MYYDNERCDGSFIKMPSKKVSEMAKDKLARINAYIKERKEKHIKYVRQEIIGGFWHRFWNRPDPTDEEIIAFCNDMVFYDRLAWPNLNYNDTIYVANRLINACQHAEELYISTEDLQRIS
jgi:hypothetical protein